MNEAGTYEGDASPSYVAGAIAGGLAIGLPNAFLNCCCFVWGPLGGIVAAWVAGRRVAWFGAQEGALAGACAGAVGWIVSAGISVPLTFLSLRMFRANPALLNSLPPELRQAFLKDPSIGELVIQQGLMLGVLLFLSVVGGLVAGQTFLRREPHRWAGVPGGDVAGDSKACPVCGERIKAVAVKCRFCGTNLAPPTAAPAPTEPPPPPAQ